jgi:hypothetical protein
VSFSTIPRDVGYLAAEKARRTPVVGTLLTAVGTITFERPQDLKKKLVGSITLQGDKTIMGKDTKFLADFKAGDTIHFPSTAVSVCVYCVNKIPNLIITEVKSDT